MTPLVIALVLGAAVLHASWNAVLRSGADRLWAVTVMSYATTLAALPFAALLPAPKPAAWPFIAASSALQVGYSIFLALAYRVGQLVQVYPIMRGAIPLMVACGAFVFAGQSLSLPSQLGIALISIGIAALALGRSRAPPASIGLALITAFSVACYVTLDGVGVRRAGDPRAYAAWIFLAYGALMPVTFRLLRGRFAAGVRSVEGAKAIGGGGVSMLSYGAMVSALALGPLGPVSALRETSVVFSVLIGRWLLREPITAGRALACATVTCGAFVIGYAS